jgi:hypothetical protein
MHIILEQSALFKEATMEKMDVFSKHCFKAHGYIPNTKKTHPLPSALKLSGHF